jgi:transposase InsO family protein
MLPGLLRALRLLTVFAGGHRALALENLALRQQLAMYRRTRPMPALRWSDRLFWVGLRRAWTDWRSALVIVRPATVVAWHRRGFAWYWTWRSRPVGGRPHVSGDVRRLIHEMADANPLWGAPRIHGELAKLGLAVSERTVSRLMPRRRRPPSQTWRTFLQNHASALVALDFCTVPTLTGRVLFVLVILAHERRRILHVNVTPHPTSAWTRQQMREAFPWDATARTLLHDRDAIFDEAFRRSVAALGLTDVRTAPRSPWQNAYVERLIGSIRRECLDHVIVFDERHLRRVLRTYVDYYHHSRTHLALEKDAPEPRPIAATETGRVVAVPPGGGGHHSYERRAV